MEAPEVKAKSFLVTGFGILMIVFSIFWGLIIGYEDPASLLAGVFGIVSGAAMVKQSSKALFGVAAAFSFLSGVSYLFTRFIEDIYVGATFSFLILLIVIFKRGVFEAVPAPPPSPVVSPQPSPEEIPSPPTPVQQPPPGPTMSYCPYCGKRLPPGSSFCPKCGSRVG
ncbi:MAG: zinc ribbon domain-containing protein [Candidatus Bathyarchaeia archaeon]